VSRSRAACPPPAERAPLPNSRHERELVGQFANALEDGDVGAIVALLTDDAWLTMPPEPYEYQEAPRSDSSCTTRRAPRGATAGRRDPGQRSARLRLLLPVPANEIARPYGLLVLTLAGNKIAEITFFADSGVFPHFGLPRTVSKQPG